MSKARAKQSQPVQSCAAYDGRELVGSLVLARDGHYEARDARGRLIGRYRSVRAAMAALPVVLR
jgi:hypothetical protein